MVSYVLVNPFFMAIFFFVGLHEGRQDLPRTFPCITLMLLPFPAEVAYYHISLALSYTTLTIPLIIYLPLSPSVIFIRTLADYFTLFAGFAITYYPKTFQPPKTQLHY
jgi:hypothetical protein